MKHECSLSLPSLTPPPTPSPWFTTWDRSGQENHKRCHCVCVCVCCMRQMISKRPFTVELFDPNRVRLGFVLLFLLDDSDSLAHAFGINHPVCSAAGRLRLVSFGMLRGWKGLWVWDNQSAFSDSGLRVQDSSCLKSFTTLCLARSCPVPPLESGTRQNLPAGLSDVTPDYLHLLRFI